MKIGLLGGLHVEQDGRALDVSGSMQVAVLFRLAIDAGTAVSYRAIEEDIWAEGAPENARAALQSIVSRLRAQLPAGAIESAPGGYRLAIARTDVDALVFTDLVAEASVSPQPTASHLASDALTLWRGEPWVPSEGFDWFVADLERDRRAALALGGTVRSLRNRAGVPAPLTGLVGRERELAAITEQLLHHRLVILIGAGGAGKTRLAVEAARHRDDVILVELAPVGPGEVLAAVLAATGREIRSADPSGDVAGTRDRVLDSLGGRDTVLLLDNCEHLGEEVAALAVDLLGAVPRLRVLATSREPLGVPGEAFVAVEPLEHPVGSQLDAEPAVLAGFSAVRLFAERAEAACGRALDVDELMFAARICARLDGLPLAIELAAAKLRTMSASEVFDGLDDRFHLLAGTRRGTLPRHQTLRAVIDWSWDLLTPDERTALSWFAVYPAGADVADAAGLAVGMGVPVGVFDALVDRSLLQRASGRYRELETVREYGIETLANDGTLAQARAAQVTHMVERARHHDAQLRGPAVHPAISWFDAEEDNITGALRFAIGARMADAAVRLVNSCLWYWLIRDRSADTAQWVASVATLAREVETDEARLINLISPIVAAFNGSEEPFAGDGDWQLMQLAASLPLFEVTADSPALAQLAVPVLRAFAEEIEHAAWMTRVTIPRGEELGLAAWPTATLTVMRAATAQNRGDIDELGEASASAIEQFSSIGDWWGLALAQQMRSEWLSVTGDLEAALAMGASATENLRRITSSWDLAQQRALTVSVLLRLRREDAALALLHELLAEADESGNIRTQATVVSVALYTSVSLGDVAAAEGYLARLDELLSTLTSVPRQTRAITEAGRAGIAVLESDWEAADTALRAAVGHALACHDHPIIGLVALELGSFALARGNVPEAVRALDLASAIIGAEDPTDIRVQAIVRAAAEAGVGRGSAALTRPTALEELRQLGG